MTDIASITVTPVTGTKTIYGNKRIQISDLTIGNGSATWPPAGLSLYASAFGMSSIDYMAVDGGSLVYKYTPSSSLLQAYTADATGGNAKLFLIASSAVPSETVRAFVIGSGLG